MKLLDRHITSEFLQILTLGTLSVLGIFFGTVEFKNMLFLMSQFDVPVQSVMTIWLLQIPTGALYALPAGMMLSTMLVVMRQHRDSELVALQTLGVSRWRCARAFIAMGIVCSIGSFLAGEYIAPQARRLSSKLLIVEACKTAHPCPHLSKIEIKDTDDNVSQITILGNTVDRSVNGFLLLNMCRNGIVEMTWSRLAERIRGDWRLSHGHLFKMFTGEATDHKGAFGSLTVPTASPLWSRVEKEPMSPLEKTTDELRRQIDRCHERGVPVPGDTTVQYYRRFSQPFSCLLLVLVALPIGLVRNRRDLRVPLLYGAIVVPAYFVLQQIFLSLGEAGRLDAAVAAWAPSLVLTAVAGIFAWFASK